MTTDYQKQATDFLTRFGIRFEIKQSGSDCPAWSGDSPKRAGACPKCGSVHGLRYLVELERSYVREDGKMGHARISFPFWGSAHDEGQGRTPDAYDVLACISSDAHCPETFEDFCGEYGYDTDSRKALATFNRSRRFAEKLTGFFTSEELEALAEIN